MNEVADLFVKYNVPDEILEKIISYVPSKHNCFLVSKRFYRETIRATRGKCLVNLTSENLESPGFMNIQFEFDEIRLANDSYGETEDFNGMSESLASKSLKFIEKFGFRIKKFLLHKFGINTSDLLKLLHLMPNLIELQLNCNVRKDYEQFLQNTPEPVGILELKLLEKLVKGDCSVCFELMDRISCPSLVTYRNDRDSQFPQILSRTLKDVEFNMDLEAQTETFRELRQRRLDRMSICIYSATLTQIVQLIESQPQLKSLEIDHDISEELQFRQICTPELLRSISNLKHLESLGMNISTDTIFPHSLVRKIMQMPKLTSLKIDVENGEFINSMLSVRNEQLQSLEFQSWSENIPPLSRIGYNFPNLKHLRVFGDDVNIKFIDRLKKLESLELIGVSLEEGEELEVNESVRFLAYEPKPELDSVGLKLTQAMPNIEKICLGPFQGTASVHVQLLNQILSLRNFNLVEIQCSPDYLLEDEVIACIKNRPRSSKLQRIKFNLDSVVDDDDDSEKRKRLSESVAQTYRNHFPIKRMKYGGRYIEVVTLSRF